MISEIHRTKWITVFFTTFVFLLSTNLFLNFEPTSAYRQSEVVVNASTSSLIAGYEVSGNPGSLNFVAGDWFIPKVSCQVGENSMSFYQIGFDSGGLSNGLVADGVATSSGCVVGIPSYEWYFISEGKLSELATPLVHPGDHMSGRISISKIGANNLKMVIKDLSKGHSWSVIGSFNDGTMQRASAVYCITAQPPNLLSNFSLIKTTLNKAGFSGQAGTIGSFESASGFSVTTITLVDGANRAMATPSALTGTTGSDFKVIFNEAN
jgi:Peptidase A4 family